MEGDGGSDDDEDGFTAVASSIESLFDICFSLWLRIWARIIALLFSPLCIWQWSRVCVCGEDEASESESEERNVRGSATWVRSLIRAE